MSRTLMGGKLQVDVCIVNRGNPHSPVTSNITTNGEKKHDKDRQNRCLTTDKKWTNNCVES